MRVLIAFEATHASHASVFGESLRILRPGLEVRVVDLLGLRAGVSSFSPQLVISSRGAETDRDGRVAWFRLSSDPGRFSEARLDGRTWWSLTNPSLEDVLAVVDETKQLVHAGHRPGLDGGA